MDWNEEFGDKKNEKRARATLWPPLGPARRGRRPTPAAAAGWLLLLLAVRWANKQQQLARGQSARVFDLIWLGQRRAGCSRLGPQQAPPLGAATLRQRKLAASRGQEAPTKRWLWFKLSQRSLGLVYLWLPQPTPPPPPPLSGAFGTRFILGRARTSLEAMQRARSL